MWFGLMGFSLGAQVRASLRMEQQAREEFAQRAGSDDVGTGPIGIRGLEWKFAVLLAGRAPLSNLNPGLLKSRALVRTADLSEGFEFVDEKEYRIRAGPDRTGRRVRSANSITIR